MSDEQAGKPRLEWKGGLRWKHASFADGKFALTVLDTGKHGFLWDAADDHGDTVIKTGLSDSLESAKLAAEAALRVFLREHLRLLGD